MYHLHPSAAADYYPGREEKVHDQRAAFHPRNFKRSKARMTNDYCSLSNEPPLIELNHEGYDEFNPVSPSSDFEHKLWSSVSLPTPPSSDSGITDDTACQKNTSSSIISNIGLGSPASPVSPSICSYAEGDLRFHLTSETESGDKDYIPPLKIDLSWDISDESYGLTTDYEDVCSYSNLNDEQMTSERATTNHIPSIVVSKVPTDAMNSCARMNLSQLPKLSTKFYPGNSAKEPRIIPWAVPSTNLVETTNRTPETSAARCSNPGSESTTTCCESLPELPRIRNVCSYMTDSKKPSTFAEISASKVFGQGKIIDGCTTQPIASTFSLLQNAVTHLKQASFPQFRRLPPEIQDRIWSFAAPTGLDEHGLRILALDRKKAPKKDWRAHNADRLVVLKRKTGKLVTSRKLFDIRLSECCKDSRHTYLHIFSNTLPVYKGKVHYDDATTLYFTDFYWALWYPRIETGLRKQASVPQWIRSIKRMALPDYHIAQHRFTNFHLRYPRTHNGLFSLLPAFTSLQQLYAIITTIIRKALRGGDFAWTKRVLQECLEALTACSEARYFAPSVYILERQMLDGREVGVEITKIAT